MPRDTVKQVYFKAPTEKIVVTDLGARGDGVNDDTLAIQTALNSGGPVYLPPGTYKISSTLNITQAGMMLTGASQALSILQPASGFTGAYVIKLTGADNASIRDLGIQGASVVYSNNPAVGGIQVNNSNNISAHNVNALYLNGTALQINSNATGDSFFPRIINFHAFSCAAGIQLVGSTSADFNMGAFLTNITCDVTQNGDAIQLLDVHDVTMVNYEGSSVAGGSALHIKGACAAIYLDNSDVGALVAGAAAPNPTVLIDSSGLGSPKQVIFTGSIIENGLTGATVSAGTEIIFNGVHFIKNGTHGLNITGGSLISVQSCTFDTNGFTAGAAHYDINDSSTGTVYVTDNTLATPAGSGSGQVASAMNFTAGTSYVLNNVIAGATAFTGFPTIARGNPGYNPVGRVAPPTVPASGTTLLSPFGSDATVHITGGTVTVISIGAAGGFSTGLTSGTFRVPAGQSITLTYSASPTWTWFLD